MRPTAFAPVIAALNRRLDAPRETPLALALSGGSDSLALLGLTRTWAQAADRPLCAFTVDHGLHPDSARWTAEAGEAAGRLGVAWCALSWSGPKPASGLPAAARAGRHALLAQATRTAGAHVLLLGHTADDVAESELIRAETPTHGRLAEWSPSPAWPEGRGVFLLRPLLSMRRAELQDWLAAEGLSWLDDPANSDLRFARSRARRTLGQVDDAEAVQACSQFAEEPDERRAGEGRVPGAWEQAGCELRVAVQAASSDGSLDFQTAALLTTKRPADAFAKALVCVSGHASPPRGADVRRLLDRLAAAEPVTATLAGVRLRAAAGRTRLVRELGRHPPPKATLTPGVAHVFDGRFELMAEAPAWRVAPLDGHAASLSKRDRAALHRLPADVRPSLPALLGPGGEICMPKPFGHGPATAHCLVAVRLAAAWRLHISESALEPAREPQQARGAKAPLILS